MLNDNFMIFYITQNYLDGIPILVAYFMYIVYIFFIVLNVLNVRKHQNFHFRITLRFAAWSEFIGFWEGLSQFLKLSRVNIFNKNYDY